MLIAVASFNPVKLEAAQRGAAAVFEHVRVIATEGNSTVSAQPRGDEETIRGARARAHGALQNTPEAQLGMGLEGGVIARPEGLFCVAWCAVVDQAGRVGLGSAGVFQLPPKVAELVNNGVELGHADDIVFGRTNSKQKDGAIGVLTQGRITRADYYAPMVTLALVRFLRPELYGEEMTEHR